MNTYPPSVEPAARPQQGPWPEDVTTLEVMRRMGPDRALLRRLADRRELARADNASDADRRSEDQGCRLSIPVS